MKGKLNLVTFVTAALCLVLAACGKGDDKKEAPAKGQPPAGAKGQNCGVAAGAIAEWLTTQKLGPKVDGADGARRDDARKLMDAYVAIAGYDAWCGKQEKKLDEACLQASGGERAECKDALAAIGALKIAEKCATELAAAGPEWLAIDDGLKADAAEFAPRVDGYKTRLPGDMKALCADGIELQCFGVQSAPPCKALLGKLRASLATLEAPAPDGGAK